jgi:NAD(P)-dependent dehydrogenase (short-subunit alcohol dehydrogenase family)
MAPGNAGREPVDLVVSNAGDNQRLDFRDLSAAAFEEFWRVGCLSGFLVGREAARRLVPLGRGTVTFTGASASLRGKPGYAHFAAAKAGLRAVAQSMAREYGPLGLHVAHGVIDGGIDGERLRSRRPQVAEERGGDGLLGSEAIAEAYWQIHRQPRSAWTHELDLRPFKEPF